MNFIRWILVVALVLAGLGMGALNLFGSAMSDVPGTRLDPWMIAWSVVLIVAGVFVALIH